jgi:hypothetical protein
LGVTTSARQAPTQPANELDAFMEKVLKRRDVNRQTLEQYVLDETEEFEVLGPSRMSMYRQKREFTWYVRDSLHVRSPVRFDGVAVGDAEREQYEQNWARRERGRLERKKNGDKESPAKEPAEKPQAEPESAPAEDPAIPGGASPIPSPRFVSEAYFMDFKFEPGNYYLAGREQLEGKAVLRIEYYPTKMFGDDDRDEKRSQERTRERQRERNNKEREFEQRIERQMNKTALITLWVDPTEHQIVKYTFDNVWMDFLPGGWLVKVDDIRASMTMGQPFPGVWLPRDIGIHAGITLALGPFEAMYARRFEDYKQADVKSKIRVPKELPAPQQPSAPARLQDESAMQSGPFVPDMEQLVQPAEVISEIRVHGNAYLKDEEVIKLAGVAIGQPFPADGVATIERRLKDSGHFDSIEVRKRYRSLESTTDIALVLLVNERAGFTSETVEGRPSAWGWSRLKSKLMFLPILDYDDGYGFTYGGRISTIGLLGGKERLSAPLTWGGTRRAAIELDRTFTSGPLTRVASTFGITQRENPRFEIDDQRVTWTARAERSFARIIRAGFDTAHSNVEFGVEDDRMWTFGADVALDTRGDPGFPRNGVYLSAGWTGYNIDRLDEPINLLTTEARGYVGVIRQAVLAGRVLYSSADRTLPDYERLLLGGASTLRGFRTGAFDGDRLLAASAELRVPLTSVLNGSKLGVTAFFDAGKVYNVGQRPDDVDWERGVGGGVFLIATIFRINVDVAHGLKNGDTRVHLSSGFSF